MVPLFSAPLHGRDGGRGIEGCGLLTQGKPIALETTIPFLAKVISLFLLKLKLLFAAYQTLETPKHKMPA
jgi:hypothetical protein